MFRDYKVFDKKCILCSEESPNGPLCYNCYEIFKKFSNKANKKNYKMQTQETMYEDLIQLFAFMDKLEEKDLISEQTEFLMDLAQKYRTWNEEYQKEHEEELIDPRKKWPAKYRCKDGHYVRSRAELLIDNWLLNEKIVHIYEKQVLFNNGEKRICDFYLPEYKVYIEFWGMNDNYYLERKQEKTNLYKKEKLELISLEDKDLENIDDILEQLILQRKKTNE